MKGINLKKIGAIVAGATILASSVTFAGLMFENTELVNANGVPIVKVVLGDKAAASDGVVASAIAAKIASSAYMKKTLTAAVASDATCNTAAATSGTGGCAVTNKKVTLEVTVPGATNTGVHEFSTLIADYIDRELGNRNNSQASIDTYLLSESENDENANPFYKDGTNGFVTSDVALYKIGKNFAPFASKTISDPTGPKYTETQAIWIKGQTEFSSSDAEVEGNIGLVVYQVKFDESTHTGIPVCTRDADSDKNWADCGSTSSEYTGKHRLNLSLLGSDWIITEMEPSSGSLDTVDKVESTSGSITLAKESVYGYVNAGQSLNSTDKVLKVRLDDISTPVGGSNVAPAIVSYIDANGIAFKQGQINPGDTIEERVGEKLYKIRVYQTAPGLFLGAKWAEIAILEHELKLEDGKSLKDDKNNVDWTVELMWKNKDAAAGVSDYTAPDALRSILFYKSSFGDSLEKGKSINVLEDPHALYKLTYKGLNLKNADYDSLKYATGGSVNLNMHEQTDITLPSDNSYIKVTSTVDDAFTLGNGKGKDFYYLLNNVTGNASISKGDVLMKKSGSTKYIKVGTLGNAVITYKTAGSLGTVVEGGAIVIKDENLSNFMDPLITLVEDAGKFTTNMHIPTNMSVLYNVSGFYSADSISDSKVTFARGNIPVGLGYSSSKYDEGKFISPRGSKFKSMEISSVVFDVAKNIAHAQYEFATTSAANQGAATTDYTLTEGQTQIFGDVTVKIKSITETVGACTAVGGSATCTIAKDKIQAVIMPNNAATVEVKEIVPVNQKLVVLDKDVANTTTGVFITVGGNAVNTVTADAMADPEAKIDFAVTNQVVKKVGNKIIVAGLTAADTIIAGEDFLKRVTAQ